MLLANPKTLAAAQLKQTEADKNASKGSAKKGAKPEKDPLASLPTIADLLQLSADSSVAASGLGSIDFVASPVQRQQSQGMEMLMARQPQEASPPPPQKPRSKLSPTRLVPTSESPIKRGGPSPSPQNHAPKVAGRDKSSSPSKSKGADSKGGKSPGKGKGGDAKDALAQAADYTRNKREAELLAEIAREKDAAASAAALVSDLRRELTEAKQRLVQVESGSELSGLQFAVSNLEQLLRQSEQDRVGLLQVRAALASACHFAGSCGASATNTNPHSPDIE
jgi:hypothetical protein